MTRTMVITGASAGIGRAIALEAARRGWHLGLASRRREALETLRGEIDAVTAGRAPTAAIAEVDVADPSSAAAR
ncbi:MAG: SDR family NAD(P)-dependent oxidoreductase, partial [Gammaproteobacteria bacterium]